MWPGHILGPASSEISKSNEFVYNIFRKKFASIQRQNMQL